MFFRLGFTVMPESVPSETHPTRTAGSHLANTGLMTANLREKGTDSGKPFDYTLWFTDTYLRTPLGMEFFGQASRPLPNNER